jgi:4,5-DOPA dioxygenase extradiol
MSGVTRPEILIPAVFFGHGSPMNALGGRNSEAWRSLGETMPQPKAVLMISAHWYIDGLAITAEPKPRTIHDFYGFPDTLYQIRYPAPGAPWLVERVRQLVGPSEVHEDHDWGLDHGTWAVLTHVYPGADVPVVQLSLDRTRNGAFHYDLGRRLRPLRDEGVLIAGSGDVVHNLRAMRRDGSSEPFDWAVRFNEQVKAAVRAGAHSTLVDFAALGEDARLAIPTPEHYLPLLPVLAQQDEGEVASFFNDRIELGSVSMLGVRIG